MRYLLHVSLLSLFLASTSIADISDERLLEQLVQMKTNCLYGQSIGSVCLWGLRCKEHINNHLFFSTYFGSENENAAKQLDAIAEQAKQKHPLTTTQKKISNFLTDCDKEHAEVQKIRTEVEGQQPVTRTAFKAMEDRVIALEKNLAALSVKLGQMLKK